METLTIRIQADKKEFFLALLKEFTFVEVDEALTTAKKAPTTSASDNERTIEQAAEVLFVPVDFVHQLLTEKAFSYREVDGQSLIPLNELIVYKQKMKENRAKQLSFLANQAQELNLGYFSIA